MTIDTNHSELLNALHEMSQSPAYAVRIQRLRKENMTAHERLARSFHELYEELAPSFGYSTRDETKVFDPASTNGRLMVAVCERLIANSALCEACPLDEKWHKLRDAAKDLHDFLWLNVPELIEVSTSSEMAGEGLRKRLQALKEALKTLSCPVCAGDCAGANPPVTDCPMQNKYMEAPRTAALLNRYCGTDHPRKTDAFIELARQLETELNRYQQPDVISPDASSSGR